MAFFLLLDIFSDGITTKMDEIMITTKSYNTCTVNVTYFYFYLR